MIKNLLLFISLIITAGSSMARETIAVVWPFGPGDTAAQYSRSLISVLNRSQDQYTFVFENRPGAGSSIAANHVLKTPNSLLSASTAFFVRPNFYPDESHDVSKFTPIITQCAAPMVIVSGKYRTWRDIPQDAQISIAISGIGTTTNLVATEIRRRYPNLTMVPYKGIREAVADVIAGRVDLQVSFFGEIADFVQSGQIHQLGVTGPAEVDGVPTLASQGFQGMERVVNMHSILAPNTMDPEMIQRLRKAISVAIKSDPVLQSYRVDRCAASNLDARGVQRWFDSQIVLWRELASRAR